MKMGLMIKILLAATALWGMADSVMAKCTVHEHKPTDDIMPLQISAITVGRDVPLGSIVFRQYHNTSSDSLKVSCQIPFQANHEFKVDGSSKANWTTGPYAHKVFKTNINGLGVAFKRGPEIFPWKSSNVDSGCGGTPGGTCDLTIRRELAWAEILLIKIGDVSPGLLRGNQLPLMSMYYHIAERSDLVFKVKFSGNIQIVANTCVTPHVPVTMGTYMLKDFKGVGSATAWRNFDITLKNCPAFNGIYDTLEGSPAWTSPSASDPGGLGHPGFSTDNDLKLRIDPTRPAINAQKGVLSLDPSGTSSTPAATGIGVQIADSSGEPLPLATAYDPDLYLRTIQSDYIIPLRARYLQTSSKVTPGPANASASFTIIYQ
ncbi:fimbrial protein [Pseudomonas sp. GZD-222]|uniref:fimbrial protein n=1 Tax=Pseudomonas sp. GZD-222 TaxID=3404805 RepID=UPI003BB4D33D